MKKYIPILFLLLFCQGLQARSPWLQFPLEDIPENPRSQSDANVSVILSPSGTSLVMRETTMIGLEYSVSSDYPANFDFLQGSKFEFYLVIRTQGYQNCEPLIKVGEEVFDAVFNEQVNRNCYSIDINNDINITIKLINDENLCKVVFPSDMSGYKLVKTNGRDFHSPELQFDKNEGSQFQFKLDIQNGYRATSSLSVTAGGTELTPNAGGVYTISNIQEDKNITVTGVGEARTITLPTTENGYSLVKPDDTVFDPDDLIVGQGDNFQFKLKLDPSYSGKEPEVQVSGSSSLSGPDADGIYTISDIQEDADLTFYFKKEYNVVLPTVVGATTNPVAGTYQVDEGDGFSFVLTLDADCNQSVPVVTTDRSETITPQADGSYLVGNVLQPVTISIEGIVKNPPPPDPVIPPPPVYHSVFLPEVEGATTDPVAGEYLVEAWSSFRFYLTVDEDYNQSEPVVTTDRGETISPRTNDGAYMIKYVRQPINIYIDGIVQNPPPVANAEIKKNAVEVKAENGSLSVFTPEPMRVRIYTFQGSVCKDLGRVDGYVRVSLPKGPYIVVAGEYSLKVVL